MSRCPDHQVLARSFFRKPVIKTDALIAHSIKALKDQPHRLSLNSKHLATGFSRTTPVFLMKLALASLTATTTLQAYAQTYSQDLGNYRDGTIAGVVAQSQPVVLMDNSGNVIAESRSDSNGRFAFNNVSTGPYRSREQIAYRVYDPKQQCVSRPVWISARQSYGYMSNLTCAGKSDNVSVLTRKRVPKQRERATPYAYKNPAYSSSYSSPSYRNSPYEGAARGNNTKRNYAYKSSAYKNSPYRKATYTSNRLSQPLYPYGLSYPARKSFAVAQSSRPYSSRYTRSSGLSYQNNYMTRRPSFSNRTPSRQTVGLPSDYLSYSAYPWAKPQTASQPVVVVVPVNSGAQSSGASLFNPKIPLVRNKVDFQPAVGVQANPDNIAKNINNNTVVASSSSSSSSG